VTTQNQAAFLAVIRHSEGTALAADPWRVCFGGYLIKDLSEHPAVSGEWRGERLPDHLCIAAGMLPGCVSTAAGAYQFIKPTWLRLKAKLGLTSFDAQAQDDACLEEIKSVGALDLVNAGEIVKAIEACRYVWASLPGNAAGQPQKTMADLIGAYGGAGGVFA
jgi:lysozyme